MPGIRDIILVQFDDHGVMNITFPQDQNDRPKEETEMDSIAGDNPFLETDLPLTQLAENAEASDDQDFSTLST